MSSKPRKTNDRPFTLATDDALPMAADNECHMKFQIIEEDNGYDFDVKVEESHLSTSNDIVMPFCKQHN